MNAGAGLTDPARRATAPLRRLERDAVVAAAGMAAAAFAVWPGEPRIGLGVVGGGLLAAISYRGIRAGFGADSGAGGGGTGHRRALVKFFTRHAILALAAYGMMARLRLDAVGMLAGASALVVAATAEALRGLRGRS